MNKYRHKYNIILCLVLFMVAALSSCDLEGDVDATFSQKATLKINGKMIIAKASIPTDGYGSSSDESNEKLTVNSVRILTFYNGSVVHNGLVTATGEWDSVSEAYIVSINQNVNAYIGENTVYVVLNEDANLTDQLVAIKDQTDMETLRTEGLITYDPEYFRITDESAEEPAFMMCTYDKIEVTSTTHVYDLTGLTESSFGFPMRRTMAKIVLDEIIGGVRPDGTIVGTDIIYDHTITTDQTGNTDLCQINNGIMTGSDNAKALALTNEIIIQKVELVNVPAKYSWNQDNSQYNSSNGYIDPINMTEGMTNELGYINRDWKGKIITNGTVDFTRTDALPALWKHAKNSSSYGFEEYYPFSEPWDTDNYSTNGPYYLNSGEFVQYIKDAYGENGNLEYVEGPVIPQNLQLISTLDPGVWTIKPQKGYYIPENIQPENSNHKTLLRIHYTIATIMAAVKQEEIQDAINSALGENKIPIVGEDGKTLIIEKNDNWQASGITYIRNRGHFVQNPTQLRDGYNSIGQNVGVNNDIEWGIKYDGLETIWTGTGVVINDREGYYFADQTYQSDYIDILLTNDEYKNAKDDEDQWQYDTNEDHNIYRGTEYRVKLYVTRSNENWPSRSTEANSRTINVGGEELTITGKVVATPMK